MTQNAAEISSLGQLEEKQIQRDTSRQYYWYDVPLSIARTTGVYRIALVELTGDEYLMACNRSGANFARLSQELTTEAVRRIDTSSDKDSPIITRLNTGDGSAEMFWNKAVRGMSKLRALANMSYGRIHNANQEEGLSFLTSETISAG